MKTCTHTTAIVNYDNGNTNSIKTALAELGVSSVYTSDPAEVLRCDRIILPGVGHFGTAMRALREHHLIGALSEAVLNRKTPVLGICLGMQLMTRFGEEGNVDGLGWLDVKTRRLRPRDKAQYKVPHIGWNTVSPHAASLLLTGITTQDQPFYFCHAFGIVAGEIPNSVTSEVRYEERYVAVVENGNIFGVQFHPEKSQECGSRLLANFLSYQT